MDRRYRVFVLVAPSIGCPSENAQAFDSAIEPFRSKSYFEGFEYPGTDYCLRHCNTGCIYFKFPVKFSTVNNLVPTLWHIVPLY